MNLLGLLLDKGLLTSADKAAVEAELAKKRPLDEVLNEHGIPMKDALAAAGEVYGLPGRILADPPADETALGYVPFESAKYYGFAPIGVVENVLEVGIIDPDNIEALDALQFISSKIGIPYKLFLISTQDFARILDAYQNLSGEVGKALTEYETTAIPVAEAAARAKKNPAAAAAAAVSDAPLDLAEASSTLQEDAPVTKIVSTILRYAIEGKASDIHIEPSPGKTRVRFRMDGVLHTSLELPAKVHEAVVARVKILGQLRLDEKRKPQDGRFSANADKRRIDFRVSTFPTEFGEKVVMRILDQSQAIVSIEELGLDKTLLDDVKNFINAPYGIILIAGPTGSGKSTTLFSMLSAMDRETKNVVSLEDPVEYQIPGVAQSQVRPEIGYTFASGLRSILRQDPDVIMVGEIRDKETAALAVQAALTGHLVFSTIHTNTAAGAIPRLIDMGVDPFLIAPTLIAVFGQRLVRKLCAGAGKAFPINDSLHELLDKQFADLPEEYRKNLPPFKNFYRAQPTDECGAGVKGRVAAFEVLKMSKSLEQVILKTPIEENIYAAARAGGMITMREDAVLKALNGVIPFEEVNTLGGELFPDEEADPTP